MALRRIFCTPCLAPRSPGATSSASLLAASLFSISLLAVSPLSGEELDEEWFVARLREQPVGTLQVITQPREAGGYRVRATQRLRFKREQTTIDVGVTQVFEEDADGDFLAFSMRQELSRNVVETTGEVRDGRLVLRERSVGGTEQEHEIDVPPEAVGPHRSEKILCEALKAYVGDPGAPSSVETVLFIPELRRFGTQTTTFGPVERTRVGGKPRELRRVEVTNDALPGLTITQWVNTDCEEDRFVVPVLGMELEYERTSREEALKTDVRSPPEILVSSAVRVDRPVPRDCSEARYILRLDRSSGRNSWKKTFAGPGQEVLRADANEIVLRVRKVLPRAPSKSSAERRESPGGVEEEDLAPNTYIQSDDTEIRRVARDILEATADRWECARRLERWVYRNVREKNLETAFATAREVFESREGDCTEHAVLLAALCRSAGIPARVVAGLVYHNGAFVGHMWTQVHVGEWIPLDATIGRGEVGADHIAFSSSSLGVRSIAELFIDLVQLLGHLEIEVVETK